MKKSLIFAAMTAVALTSCSKDDTVSINEKGKGVTFGVLNNKVQGKATELTVSNIGAFNVYAYKFASGETPNYKVATPFYSAVKITVSNDGTGTCAYDDPTKQKMWPTADLLNFFAWAPTDYATYSEGIVSADFETKVNAADQKDLLVAQAMDQKGYGVDNYKTAMKFYHALAQIQFKAVSKYATVDFKIKSITITGVTMQGTVNLTTWTPTTPVGTNNTGNGLVWQTNGAIKNIALGANTTQVINTSPVNVTADNGALMVIPQTLKGGTPIVKGTNTVENILSATDKSYIVIEYSATDKDTKAVLVENGRCAAPVSTILKPGLKYIYTMTLTGKGDGGETTDKDKLYPIDFSCSVEGWTESPLAGEI